MEGYLIYTLNLENETERSIKVAKLDRTRQRRCLLNAFFFFNIAPSSMSVFYSLINV